MQCLRGKVYREDGAIQASDLNSDGRHVSGPDRESWHLLIMGPNGFVLGCTRFQHHMPHEVSCDDLGVSSSPLASCPSWGSALRASIGEELRSAREAGFSYFEIGGWALAPELRNTAEALRSVLAIFALGSMRGGALGVGTVTERNASSSILRRLGGRPLEWDGVALPGYYDEKYRCGMEVLRFDSRNPNPRYAGAIDVLRRQLRHIPVVCPDPQPGWLQQASRNFIPSFAGFGPSSLAVAV